MKLLNNYFLVADIKPEILRYLRPPTDVIFRYLAEIHPEAILRPSLLKPQSVQYNCTTLNLFLINSSQPTITRSHAGTRWPP